MSSYDIEDAIVVTEPTEIEVEPTNTTESGVRGVSGPIVNQENATSETPSNLVAPGEGKELSPNPAKFGFIKQLLVDSLPGSGQEVDTLYLLKVKNNGVVIGYRLYRWDKINGYEEFGATPDLKLENGKREQKAVVGNEPNEVPEKVFMGKVVFNGPIVYKGKQLKNEDDVGSIVEANPTLAGTETELNGLNINGTKYKIVKGTKLYRHLVTVSGINLAGEEGGCQLCIISASSQQIASVFDGNYISVKIWDSTIEECRGYIVYLDGTDLSAFEGKVDPETGDLIFVPTPDYCLSEVTIESDQVTAL